MQRQEKYLSAVILGLLIVAYGWHLLAAVPPRTVPFAGLLLLSVGGNIAIVSMHGLLLLLPSGRKWALLATFVCLIGVVRIVTLYHASAIALDQTEGGLAGLDVGIHSLIVAALGQLPILFVLAILLAADLLAYVNAHR